MAQQRKIVFRRAKRGHWRLLCDVISVLLLVISGASSWAQEASSLEHLNPPLGQQLPLADERFRIDSAVDEITLAFFRVPDSAPIVVILPDGSKWYASRYPKDKVKWRTGHDYDFLTIQQPMPGPWQVSGRIRPESRVMLVSDIEFHPEPFPPLVFVGERLKLVGRLTNAGQAIDQLDFRNIIRLELVLQSTNNPKYDNFGQPPVRVGEFLDDGRLMDEVARDGVFTGQFDLTMSAGEYVPRYQAKTPLFERVVEGPAILIQQQPVRPKVTVSHQEGVAHQLVFEVDEDYIRADDLVITGRITYPNGERQQVSISTAQGDSLTIKIPSYTFGVFELRTFLSGTDIYGREFKAEMTPFDFRSQRLYETGPSANERALAAAKQEEQVHQEELVLLSEGRQVTQRRIFLVVGVNLLIVATWMLFMLLRKQKMPAKKKDKAA